MIRAHDIDDGSETLKLNSAIFGPGFSGGSWMQGGEVLDSFSLDAGKSVPETLFEQINAFCQDIPAGGAVGGYIGYEAAAAVMPDLKLPDAQEGLPLVHLQKFASLEMFAPKWGEKPEISSPHLFIDPSADIYSPKVQSVIDAILEGDIFQANISRHLIAEWTAGEPEAAELFSLMVSNQTADYAAFIPMDQGAVLSNSPELFLSIKDGTIAAEPIKGTAPRSSDLITDQKNARDLQSNEKDRAENVMIADLLRNDLAKVCEDYSISEPAICELRSLKSVHHLYSRIEGRLRANKSPIDAIVAAFPCGSITGAPKHRAMQIIADQEGEGRGPYCGTICLIRPRREAVFSVAIRTASFVKSEGLCRLSYRAGGGVTALSDPYEEYRETVQKSYPFRVMTS